MRCASVYWNGIVIGKLRCFHSVIPPVIDLDVGVAELIDQRLRGDRAAVGRLAVEDHALVEIRGGAADALLEVSARHVLGAGDVRLVPLVLLAHVDDDGLGLVALEDRLEPRSGRPRGSVP